MIMKSDINKLGCILFVHLSSISLENFKDLALIIPEILELIKLHTYKFGLVYIHTNMMYIYLYLSFDNITCMSNFRNTEYRISLLYIDFYS